MPTLALPDEWPVIVFATVCGAQAASAVNAANKPDVLIKSRREIVISTPRSHCKIRF
jgi:hypothetical protein